MKSDKNDRPLVVQLAGHDIKQMLFAAKELQKIADAIDINFGCPQNIAKKGRYGAFLLNHPDIIRNIVKTLSTELDIPIFCKIRILDD